MLSEIEKKEFLRSKTHCGSPDSVPEPDPCDLPVDEYVLPGGLNCLVIFMIIFMWLTLIIWKKVDSFLLTFRRI